MKSLILTIAISLCFGSAFADGISAQLAASLINSRCKARTHSDWSDMANAIAVCTPSKERSAIDCTNYCAENYHSFFLNNFMNLTFTSNDYLGAEKTHRDFTNPIVDSFILKNKKTNRHYEIVAKGNEKYIMDYNLDEDKIKGPYPYKVGCGTLVKIEDDKCVPQKYNSTILGLFKTVQCINDSGGPNSRVQDIKHCDDLAKAMTHCLNDYKSCEAKILSRNERLDGDIALLPESNNSNSRH